jgi:hypothetical protein
MLSGCRATGTTGVPRGLAQFRGLGASGQPLTKDHVSGLRKVAGNVNAGRRLHRRARAEIYRELRWRGDPPQSETQLSSSINEPAFPSRTWHQPGHGAKPFEDPLRGVPLLSRPILVHRQDPINDPGKRIQLRTRPRVDPKSLRRFPPARTFNLNRKPNLEGSLR